jgi:ketosteroid isomerase-like protein
MDQPPTECNNLALARRFIAAVERGATDEVAALLADDVIQEEFPNRLMPSGATRDRTAILEAGERGKKAMSSQRYEVTSAVASGDLVALELKWTGTLAVPLGTLPVGGEMRARYAIFIEFKSGKIRRIRNYDCFEPW